MESNLKISRDRVSNTINKNFNVSNINLKPKLVKVVVSRGLGEALSNNKAIETSIEEFKIITGRAPIVTYSKKSIAGFKLREDVPIGLKVTLRQDAMYAFLDKLINLALPRIRDFQGISRSGFDGNGNYNIGIKEQTNFPEIEFDEIDRVRGFNISIITSTETDATCFKLLEALGFPFEKE